MPFASFRQFGGRAPAEPIPRRQKCVASAAAATLLWATWALTASTPATLLVATALSALTFALLFVPVGGEDSAASAKLNLSRLLRFPLFWIGVLLWLYIVAQGCAPGLSVIWKETSWSLKLVPDAPQWFPTGIDAPFGFETSIGGNAWRELCHFGSAWLLLCALWCGVRSRRLWKALLWAFALNALVLAGFGLYRLAMGTGASYLGVKGFQFFSAFSYKNHAGAFFTLAIAVCAGLGLRQWREAARECRRGGPHLILLVFGLIFLGTVFATKSVGGVFLAVCWLPLALVLVAFSGLMSRDAWIPFGVFLLMLLGVAGTWWATADTSVFFSRVDQKVAEGELPDVEGAVAREENPFETFSLDKGSRAELRRLSAKMYRQNTHTEIFGWGAGAYRWVAPVFQLSMDEFTRVDRRTGKKRLISRTEYAHCDPWHFLVEWGAVGGGIFFAGVAWFFGWALLNVRRWRASSVALLAGTLIFCAHACVEFVSFNLALLFSVAFLAAAFRADLRRDGDGRSR